MPCLDGHSILIIYGLSSQSKRETIPSKMARCISWCLLSLLTILQWMSLAEASHFRAGHITWKPDSNNTVFRVVNFRVPNRFGGMRDLAYFCGDIRDAS